MKTWIKRTLIGAVGASVLFGGLAACASRHHDHGWQMSESDVAQMRERVIDRASRELKLDAAQKAKLGGLADAVAAQRAALRAQPGADPRAELQALVAGAQFDRTRAQALLDAKTGAVHDKAPAVIAAMGDFYDSLKPEQQQQLRDWMAKGGHGHRGWWRG